MSRLLNITLLVVVVTVTSLYADDMWHRWAEFMQEHDLNKDGVINGDAEFANLRHFFLQEKIPETKVEEVLRNGDENGDMAIDPEEYRDIRIELLNTDHKDVAETIEI
ncbi:hypothetical protein SNE40_006224 [Patella caerulea]|uniref:EF-hand domain-containing protein n=1 Tax=Patella caerulea TaxID=87958 RepID=A0AAN8K1W5_PATCE